MVLLGDELKLIPLVGEQRFGEGVFPLAYVSGGDEISWEVVEEWIEKNRETLLAEAFQSGAVLFRGCPVRTAEDFDRFIRAFHLENFPYDESLSNAVRINKTPRVFTANEAPPTVPIFLHHEMAQTPVFPSRLFFFCEQAADTGGATALCRSDVLWERIAREFPEFAHDCEEKGLRYSNVMPAVNDLESGMGRSWQSTLRVATKTEAEARLTTLNYDWTWLEDDCLRATTPVLPAVRLLNDGRKSFFNQLIAAFKGWKDKRNDPSKAITFGDGTRLDRETVDQITLWADELSFDLTWQTGDVAIVDNYVTMHGRRPFTGVRKVLASLVLG
ncbi:TauD/TfdA family dioxygenase [bacterium]|nr:TauD/TfdA family dioxygenase [bacterium]